MTDHGHFCWNELMTRDVESAKAFYSDTIGWQFNGMDDPEGGTYWIAMDGDQPVAGICDISGPMFDGIPPQWKPYLAVDDVDARVEKAVQAGAKIIKSAFDIPGVGRIIMLEDAGGAGIGWMTPAEQS
ncbi:MAG: VOC family protein [Alphaproteobacteria bacterium]|nr:VOC family protein [Alphaproteobacteria bacterium]